ncbi:MAG: hypothetical protein WHU10_12045, partial [Fimbriimonadales bacterium]
CGIPEGAVVLGEYTQTGLPSFLMREFGKEGDRSLRWKSVFLGEPVVTPSLIRALGQLAGAHVWNFQDDVVHVRPPFLLVHCSGSGPRTVALPGKWSAFNLLAGEWAAEETTNLRFHGQDGTSHLFLVGPKLEIEHLLQTDFDEALKFPEIPPRDENTIETDAADFDVPIMKLDEWIEGASLDELAEEWMLRPKIAEEAEEPEPVQQTPGSRRRRRRKSTASEPRSVVEDPTSEPAEKLLLDPDDTLGLNVIFRRRE